LTVSRRAEYPQTAPVVNRKIKHKKSLQRFSFSSMLAFDMRKDRSIQQCAQAIKALKPGGSFGCRSKAERSRAVTTATTLYRAGVIDFQIHSKQSDGGLFTIYRLG
jgi:hypothetical protein